MRREQLAYFNEETYQQLMPEVRSTDLEDIILEVLTHQNGAAIDWRDFLMNNLPVPITYSFNGANLSDITLAKDSLIEQRKLYYTPDRRIKVATR